MHDTTQPNGKTPLEFTKEELLKHMETIPNAQVFWLYVILEWVPKCKMQVMGNQNLPYVSHDTNATIKSYHAYLKATSRVAKSQLSKRHVDCCVHQLLGDVLLHYWYKSLKKNWGFVPNKKQEQFVIIVILHARDILNNCVIFLEDGGGYAIVTSLKHENVNYKVYNPKSEWAYCECLQSQRGNICKHQIKVLMFFHPYLTKGTITCYYG